MAAIKLNCLEPLTAIGFGIVGIAVGGLTLGAAAGGTGSFLALYSKLRENLRRPGLEEPRLIEQIRRAVIREEDDWETTQEERDAIVLADQAMAQLLPSVMLSADELAQSSISSAAEPYPRFAAHLVADRLGTLDPSFASPVDPTAPLTVARRFALTVVERALTAAMADKDYAAKLHLQLTIAGNAALAEQSDLLREVLARLQPSEARTGSRLDTDQLRHELARIVEVAPDATADQIAAAIRRNIAERDQQIAALQELAATDSEVEALRKTAERALQANDDDAAIGALAAAEAALAERRREDGRAQARLTAMRAAALLRTLDWQAADATWRAAASLAAPIDHGLALEIEWSAAQALDLFAANFGSADAALAGLRCWRSIRVHRQIQADRNRQAGIANNIGESLKFLASTQPDGDALGTLQEALVSYRSGLAMIADDGGDSALVTVLQSNIGVALTLLARRLGGGVLMIDGDQARDAPALLAEAIAAHTDAILGRSPLDVPDAWALSQELLADTMIELARLATGEDRRKMASDALMILDGGLSIPSGEGAHRSRSEAIRLRGQALMLLATATPGPDAAPIAIEAIDVLRASGSRIDRDAQPLPWALHHTALISALLIAATLQNDPAPALTGEAVDLARGVVTRFALAGDHPDLPRAGVQLAFALFAHAVESGDNTSVGLFTEAIDLCRTIRGSDPEALPQQVGATIARTIGQACFALAELGVDRVANLATARIELAEAEGLFARQFAVEEADAMRVLLDEVDARLAAMP